MYKARVVMTLTDWQQEKKKWNPIEFVHDTRPALHFRDLVVQVQQGRAGFGLIQKIKSMVEGNIKAEETVHGRRDQAAGGSRAAH